MTQGTHAVLLLNRRVASDRRKAAGPKVMTITAPSGVPAFGIGAVLLWAYMAQPWWLARQGACQERLRFLVAQQYHQRFEICCWKRGEREFHFYWYRGCRICTYNATAGLTNPSGVPTISARHHRPRWRAARTKPASS